MIITFLPWCWELIIISLVGPLLISPTGHCSSFNDFFFLNTSGRSIGFGAILPLGTAGECPAEFEPFELLPEPDPGFGDPTGPVAVSVPNDQLCVVGLTIDGCDVKVSLPGKNPVSLAVAVDLNEANVKRPAILTDTRNRFKPFRSEDL